MKKTNKVLSVILSLCLIVGGLPIAVMTAAEGTDLNVTASDSGSIKLLGTDLFWGEKLTYAGEDMYNLSLTATADSNVRFASSVRTVEEKNYFKAQDSGYYLLELWGGDGAEGESTEGSGSQGGKAGKGGYVYGYIFLNEGDVIYSSIGGAGQQVAKSDPEDNAANAGGVHGETGSYKVGGGGGYSAFYLFRAEDDFESKYVNADGSLKDITEEDRMTRYIMIAGGGGGGGTSNSLIHNKKSLLPTRQTGTADGGNGGNMSSASGSVTSGVKGTFYAGSDGKSSGKSTTYVGKGATNLPGQINTTAANVMADILEFFGIDSSSSAQPNDWTGTYNDTKAGGYGGDGNLRGGAGGAGYAGGSGGLMPNYGSANAYFIGGGGGGSSFIADSVSIDLEPWMADKLVGSNYSEAGGQSAIRFLGSEQAGGVDAIDFTHLKFASFSGQISKYFDIVSIEPIGKNGSANGTASFDNADGTFTVSNANVLNEEINSSANMLTVNIVLKAKEGFGGGNGVPLFEEGIKFDTADIDPMAVEASDSVSKVNVALDFAISGKSYVDSEIRTYALSDLYVDDYASVRNNLSADWKYDFITSVSPIYVFEGSVEQTSAVTPTATTTYDLSMTVVPKTGTPAEVGPVQAATNYTSTAVVTITEKGYIGLGNASGTVSKSLSSENGEYNLTLNFSDMKARVDYIASEMQGYKVISPYGPLGANTFTVPFDGWYALQAWGGKGGLGGKGTNGTQDGAKGGSGGYVYAYAHLEAGQVLQLTRGANGTQGDKADGTLDTGSTGHGGACSAIYNETTSQYLIIAGGGGGGCGYGLFNQYSSKPGESVNNEESAIDTEFDGDLTAYNGVADPPKNSAGEAGKNFRNTVCTNSTENIDVQLESFAISESDHETGSDGGVIKITPISVDCGDCNKASRFYDISIKEDISQYFEVKSHSVTINGAAASSYDFDASTNTFSNIRFNSYSDNVVINSSSADYKTVPLNGTLKANLVLVPKEGFLGGNDVPMLTGATVSRTDINGTTASKAVPAENSTDYANVEIDYTFDGDITTIDKTVTAGTKVYYSDLYTRNKELPTGDDAWKADYVTYSVKTPGDSFIPQETTVVPITASVSPSRQEALYATTVPGVSAVSENYVANVYLEYTVDVTGSHFTFNGDNTVDYGSNYTAEIVPEDGYVLPDEIIVTSGGNTLTAGSDYEYSKTTGELIINSSAITGNITITVAVAAKTYTIKFSDASVTNPGETIEILRTNDYEVNASITTERNWAQNYANRKAPVTGYTFKWDEIPTKMPANDLWIFGDYEPDQHKLIIHYVDGEGTPVADDYTEDTWYSNTYSVVSPEVPGYVPQEAVVSGAITETDPSVVDIEITVTYEKADRTLSIFYVYSADNTDDLRSTKAYEDYSVVYDLDAPYEVASPVIPGYTASVDTVSGTMDEDGEVVYVYYTQNTYTVTFDAGEGATVSPASIDVLYNDVFGFDSVSGEYGSLPTPLKTGYTFVGWYKDLADESTLVEDDTIFDLTDGITLYAKFIEETHTIKVNYVYADDSEAAPSVSDTLNYGAEYSYTSPHITGYAIDKEVVSGVVGNSNEVIFVHYELIVHTKEELKAALDEAKALDEEDYTGTTWAALEDVVNDGDEVYADDDATVEEISIATEAILEALEKLIDRSELKDAIDEATDLKSEPDYEDLTEEQKDALDDAIAAAQEVYDDPDATKEEIEAAEAALKDAIKDVLAEELENKVDEGKDILDDAENDPDIPDDKKDDLQDAIDKAEEVLGKTDPPATQEEIEEALEELQEAIDNILKEELGDALDDAEDLKDQHPAYDNVDPAIQEALDDAIEAAEEVLGKTDPPATQEELEQALEDLEKAIEDVIRDEIENLIDEADEVKDEHPAYDDVDPALQEALDEAEEAAKEILAKDPPATQEELEQALEDLEKAIEDVRRDELENLIDEVSELDSDDYTGSSWQEVQDKIAAAEELLEKTDPAATKEEIEQAIQDIKDAVDDLIDRSGLGDAIDDAEDLQDVYSYNDLDDEAKQSLQDVIDAAKEVYNDPDATAQEIEDATNAFKDALEDILESAIEEAEKVDRYYFTEGSLEDLDEKVDNGKDILDVIDDTPVEDIFRAAQDILDALDELIDKRDLEYAVDIAESINPDRLTDDTKAEFEQKIEEAKQVLNDPDATQEEIDAATEAIEQATKELTFKANYTKYNDELEKAEELNNDQNFYDPDAYEAYKQAVKDIDDNLNKNLTKKDQPTVDNATKALKEAKTLLESSKNNVITFTDEVGGTLSVIGVTPGSKFSEVASPTLPASNNVFAYAGWADEDGVLLTDDTVIDSDMTITIAREYKILVADSESGVTFANDLNDKFVYGIAPGTTVEDVLAKFENDATVLEIRKYDDSELASLDIVGTASYAVLKSKFTGEIYGTWSFIILGDVNGDGAITNDDFSISDLAALGENAYPSDAAAFALANDVYIDGVIDVMDTFEIGRMFTA